MNIDFPPTSKGTYNNAGSCRQLANYLEHEDLERMEKRIYTEGFFNLTENNIYKWEVIKDLDSNIGQLMKTDSKFYAIHVSPSDKELQAMGTTQKEQAEAMKRYIREVFIPEYAKNFNKELTAEDIKFYAKIHFDRNSTRSKENADNQEINNMHCHIIVSRKDQSNKKKLSPVTNHRDTKKGMVKGGFDRTNLFQKVEEGFDKLFNYNRPFNESFEYYNVMKNNSIEEQLEIWKKQIIHKRKNTDITENRQNISMPNIQPINQIIKKENKQSLSLRDLDSAFISELLTPDANKEEKKFLERKNKKFKRRFRR